MVSDDSSLYWVSEEPISLSVTIPTQVTSVPDVVPLSSSIEPDIMTVKTDYPDVMYIGESSKITDSITNIGSSTAGIVRLNISFHLMTTVQMHDILTGGPYII